ncbi:MAG: M28 family peptidase [Lachnospiraceae bacterium]
MNYDGKTLKKILRMTQKQLKSYLDSVLQESGYRTVNRKGFLYAPGDVPVLLVAHLDTVHAQRPEIICFSEDGRFIMSPQGIGGDDRCGVFMILQIIQEAKCHVLFCEDEETGGHGARAFTQSRLEMDVNYIVEMDRRGDNDAVFYGAIILISRISFSALALRKKRDRSVTFRWSHRIWKRRLSTSAPGTTMNTDSMSALICWLWKITSGVLCRWCRRKRKRFPSFGGRAAFTSFLYLKDRASCLICPHPANADKNC